jgi:flagellar P-ring protein FlgI
MIIRTFILQIFIFSSFLNAHADVRIKDITYNSHLSNNFIYGYGLVVGLQGTGDSIRNIPYTEQTLQSMLDHLGINIKTGQIRAKNIASVMVTAEISDNYITGNSIDIRVSSLGDAISLVGGSLIYTTLHSPDDNIIVTAQGPLAVAGIQVSGQAETINQGVTTVGHIINGGKIEKLIRNRAYDNDKSLTLLNPDYNTAIKIVDTINNYTEKNFSIKSAFELDDRQINLKKPNTISVSRFMAAIGDLRVDPDLRAQIIIDSQSGTIIISKDVKLSKLALTQGGINIKIQETPVVSQPSSLSNGATVVVPRTDIEIEQSGGQIGIIEGPTLNSLVRGLNSLGVKPTSLISILQTMKSSGSLQADIILK